MVLKIKKAVFIWREKKEQIDVDEIKHLTYKEQAEKLAEFFAKARQEYEPLKIEDINTPYFNNDEIPNFTKEQVQQELQRIKTNESVPANDIPPKVLKMFSKFLAIPVCDLITI